MPFDGGTRLVLYGLALSALDVELGEIVAAGLHEGRVRGIHIVDPNYARVAERVATFEKAGTDALPIYCCAPNRLGSTWRFDVAQLEAEISRCDREASV